MRPPEKQNTASMTEGLRPWMALECLLVFLVAPLGLYFRRQALAFRVVPLVLALITGLLLIRDCEFNRAILWSTKGRLKTLGQIGRTLPLPATLLTAAAFFFWKPTF